jgi:hypothetical protein
MRRQGRAGFCFVCSERSICEHQIEHPHYASRRSHRRLYRTRAGGLPHGHLPGLYHPHGAQVTVDWKWSGVGGAMGWGGGGVQPPRGPVGSLFRVRHPGRVSGPSRRKVRRKAKVRAEDPKLSSLLPGLPRTFYKISLTFPGKAVDVLGFVDSRSMHNAPTNDFDNQKREGAHEHATQNQVFFLDQSK